MRAFIFFYELKIKTSTDFYSLQYAYLVDNMIWAEQKELEAIAAAVIGGCLLSGGYGSVYGAAIGSLILGMVQEGIVFTRISTDWFRAVLGGMLLAAVLLNNYLRHRALRSR